MPPVQPEGFPPSVSAKQAPLAQSVGLEQGSPTLPVGFHAGWHSPSAPQV
jgi:hypothetical protein